MVVIKQAPVAPIWTRIGVPYIVFREESDGDIPGAQFLTKTTKNEQTNFESNSENYKKSEINRLTKKNYF